MAKVLNDEMVAKALGWKKGELYHSDPAHKIYQWWPKNKGWVLGVPPFTSSLDAIVAEIEAKGLDYTLSNTKQANVKNSKRACAFVDVEGANAETSCLALCMALLAFLKEPKP